MTKVYLTDKPQVGKPLMGWDPKSQTHVRTTNVVRIATLASGVVLCSTQAGMTYEGHFTPIRG